MNQSELKPESLSVAPAKKAILFSVLTLISGVIIGVGLTLIVSGDSNKPKSLPDGWMVERIARDLKLSPQQRGQLDPIVKKHKKAMDDIREEARPKIMAELEQMNDEIMAILDEEQKQIWQDKIKRMQERFTRMRQHRGPGKDRRKSRGPGDERRDGRGRGPSPDEPQHQPDRHDRKPPSRPPIPPEERPQPIPPDEPPHP